MSLSKPVYRSREIAVPEPEPWVEREVSLAELFGELARRKRLIALVTLCATAVTAAVSLLVPASYTAEAVIMPPQQDQSAQSMLMGSAAGLGGLSALAGAGMASSILRNPAELYIGVLKSRTIADALIVKFSLQPVYERKTLTDTRKELAKHTKISTGRDSLIRISVDDHDRLRAARMANAYVEELHSRNSLLAFSSASQRRVFFEEQLAGEKNALADAEIALKKMQEASGLVVPSAQSEALVRSIAQLKAEIAGREVQMQSMRLYAAGDNPQLQMLEQEASALRSQLQRLEAGDGGEGGLDVAARRLPERSLEYIRKLRDLKYHETLFEILARQYEAARIDEAKTAPVIQVVDAAVVPDKKSWPPRTLFTLGAGFLAALATSAVILWKSRPRAGGTGT